MSNQDHGASLAFFLAGAALGAVGALLLAPQSGRETREQIERGVFDIDAVSDANRMLIESIEDSLRIADEGREARAQASQELHVLEQQLRDSLAAAGARERPRAGRQNDPNDTQAPMKTGDKPHV